MPPQRATVEAEVADEAATARAEAAGRAAASVREPSAERQVGGCPGGGNIGNEIRNAGCGRHRRTDYLCGGRGNGLPPVKKTNIKTQIGL